MLLILELEVLCIYDVAQFGKSVCDNTMNIQGPQRPRGWNPFEHKRGNADGEFQNNMILSRHLSGPNKIYLNINAHRGVYYLEVLSKHRQYILSIPFTSISVK